MTLTLEDKIALSELPGRYGDYADAQDWDNIQTLFMDDSTFEFVGLPKANNLTEIMAHYQRPNPARPSGHFFTNIYSEATDTGANLNFRCVFVLPIGSMREGFTTFYGTYRAKTVKTDNDWRFKELTFHPADSYQKA